jgi:pimeloyl-ACP methyl ester carboxylesterase
MKLRTVFLVAALWLIGTRGASAAIETEDCRLAARWLATVSAQCGTLTVAENPSDPAGTKIKLFIARIPALSLSPQPDPLLLISGGPGQATTDLYLGLRAAFEPIRRDREIIVVDQRGTGRSARLSCPTASVEDLEIATDEVLRELVAGCVDELSGDPRYYTTSVAVNDLEELRVALGVAQWNIYGISYGTRVAQHYLRRFPESSRAVILDGVAPPEIALGPAIATVAQDALDGIFARCAAEPACDARFPALTENLASLSERLASSSITVTMPDPVTGAIGTYPLSSRHLQAVIRLMSYSPRTSALLPLLITEALAENYAPLAAQANMMIGDLEQSISFPMHNAVVCTEDVPFFADDYADNLENSYLGDTIVDALITTCSVWPPGQLDDDLKSPLHSDRPVLILSGDADPVTPPAYGEQILTTLSNARHLIGHAQGHGLVRVGCIPELMRQFVDQLDPQGLDASCLLREGPTPFFLEFTGPAP